MSTAPMSTPQDKGRFLHPRKRQLVWAGGLLGFALGGFFDGILLHQILQWHHLLSAVDNSALTDIRALILADGLFHALMYVLALAGLVILWRSQRSFTLPGANHALLAAALTGFGVWHVLDAVISHWILGIHRIRMDVENRLFWDVLWFVAFGVAFIGAGLWIHRKGRGKGGRPGDARPAGPALLTLAILVTGPVAAIPPTTNGMAMVLFRPGTSPTDAILAVAAVDGRLVWSDPAAQLWAIELGPDRTVLPLYRHGAILVTGTGLPAGCLDWFRITPVAG